MADLSKKAAPSTATGATARTDRSVDDGASYWKRMLKSYEKRNASLERRRNALVERVRFMECTLPSLLVGAAATAAYGKRGAPDERPRAADS